jgi:alpha-D-ribose 1-methylphosphonate 5-triphosphate synthase subunit PhnG
MQVNLEANEVAAVVDALRSYLADLRSEINHTESYDMRENLKAKEVALVSVVTRLGGSAGDIGMSDVGAKNPPWG